MNIGNIQNELKQMTVIVTGGNRGIGAGIAKAFCTYGSNVVIAARDTETGTAVARQLTDTTPGTCIFIPCDVADEAQVRAMIAQTIARFGRLDCLINNAGILRKRRPIDEIALPELRQIMDINLGGIFLTTKYALPHLRASRGSIINISSVLGHTGQEGSSIYAATKGAIIAFTKSIACDEARNGVRVNVLSPGDIRSELNHEEADNTARRTDQPPAGRIHLIDRQGEPEDIGTACLFLASSWAGFMTGSELSVDGGFFAGSGTKQTLYDWHGRMQVQPL